MAEYSIGAQFKAQLIGVVVIDDPKGKEYYGGLVAAPVFSNVMQEAARILNLTPDRPEDATTVPQRFAAWAPPMQQVASKNP